MPLLNQQYYDWLRKKPAKRCEHCQQEIRENYCRQCDEYYWCGHNENCPELEHVGHRTYDLTISEERAAQKPPSWGPLKITD